ncbi:MAG: sugar phosphate nucleotidyltransferase, partial [Acidobacteriota bacterium]
MKTVILCGGRGTRLGEHGTSVPKPLIEIGGQPILWHLLKLYSTFGLNEFVLCLGFLGDSIKRYFLEHHWLSTDFTLEMNHSGDYRLVQHERRGEDWKIAFVETGLDVNTGGRLKRVEAYLAGEEEFCVTYGDGLADIDLKELLKFHRQHGRLATLTAVHPRSNFGIISLDENGAVTEFHEKPIIQDWINGGFFVFNRRIFDYLTTDSILEGDPLQRIAAERQLIAYPH